MNLSPFFDVATVKPAVEVADIFRLHFSDYLKQYHCTPEEFAAIDAIIACRTAAVGDFIRQCDQCGKFQISAGSCANRHCPKCGHLPRRNGWRNRKHGCCLYRIFRWSLRWRMSIRK